MPSRFTPIPGGTDPSQQLAIINKNFAELDNENVKKLFYDNNGIPSIQIGVQQDGTSAIRVSKPGIDVTTATGSQLIFNSALDHLKVVATGIATTLGVTVTSAGAGNFASSGSTKTIAHGLGYTPAVIGYLTNDGGVTYSQLPYSSPSLGGTSAQALWSRVDIQVDAVNIYLNYSIMTYGFGTTAPGVGIKYFLLQETAN